MNLYSLDNGLSFRYGLDLKKKRNYTIIQIITTYYTLRQKYKYYHSNSMSLCGDFYWTIIPLNLLFWINPTGFVFVYGYYFSYLMY